MKNLRETSRRIPLSAYARYEDQVFIVKNVSVSMDRVLVRNVSTNEMVGVAYSTFPYSYERVYRVKEVSLWLNRSPQSIKIYEKRGLIDKAFSAEYKGKLTRFYDIDAALDLYEAIRYLHQGRPRKDNRVTNNTLPDYYEYSQLVKDKYKWL